MNTQKKRQLHSTAGNRVEWWWSHKNEIQEIVGLGGVNWNNKMKNVYLPKIKLVVKYKRHEARMTQYKSL